MFVTGGVDVQARAVAKFNNAGNACVLALSSSASKAVECRKKIETRESTARMRGDRLTNCTPTRIALMSRSRPSGLGSRS